MNLERQNAVELIQARSAVRAHNWRLCRYPTGTQKLLYAAILPDHLWKHVKAKVGGPLIGKKI